MSVHTPDGARQYRFIDRLVPYPCQKGPDGNFTPVDYRHPGIERAMSYFGNTNDPRCCEHRPGEWLVCPDHLSGHRSPAGEHVPPLAGRCPACFERHAHRHHDGRAPSWWARALLPDRGRDARIAIW